MRELTVCALGLAVGLVIVSGGVRVVDARAADAPVAQASATCSDYSNQAEAQRAKDTRDADADGLYCETLPCPCAKGGSPAPGGRDSSNARERAEARAKARARARAKARRRAAARERRRRARYRNVTRSVWEVTDVIGGGRFRVTKTSGPADRDEETVRLLGIDAPTVGDAGPECGSREAKSALLAALFTAPQDRDADGLLDTPGGVGHAVRLVTDPAQNLRDPAGRLLAYPEIGGADVGLGLLAAGLVGVRGQLGLQGRVKRYTAAEDAARSARLGIHGGCAGYLHVPEDEVADLVPVDGPCGKTAGTEVLAQSSLGELIGRVTGLDEDGADVIELFSLETVICEDFDRDGDDEMLVHYACCTVSSPSPVGIFEKDPAGNWQLVWARARGAVFRVEEDDNAAIATEPVYSRNDANCCPARLRDSRLGWDGRTFGVISSRVYRTPSS